MFFGGKVLDGQIRTIKNIFKLNMVSKYDKYLGLPSIIGKKKTSFLKDVKLKVLSKISSWQHKIFLIGGKKIHIKAVAQAIRPYFMSVFKLLKGLYKDMQRAIPNFW